MTQAGKSRDEGDRGQMNAEVGCMQFMTLFSPDFISWKFLMIFSIYETFKNLMEINLILHDTGVCTAQLTENFLLEDIIQLCSCIQHNEAK